MEINSINIKNIIGGNLKGNCENIHHIKSLPYLSVVQPTHGYYEISLDSEKTGIIDEGGAFVAPKGVMQNITHHNGDNGYMEAHWIFMNVKINDFFDFQDFFDIPFVFSSKHNEELFEMISVICNNSNICQKYIMAYRLIDFLITYSSPKNVVFDNSVIILKRYIEEHYSEKITNEDLADVIFCSVPNLYRIFKKNFNLSPHNYINKFRLEKSCVLLENTDSSVAEISYLCGFDDPVYYSKLFKDYYKLSPKKYREFSPFVNLERNDIRY